MILGTLLQREKTSPTVGLWNRGDAFESRLEDAVQYALEEIKKLGRGLGRNTPYKQSNPHTYVYVAHKFNHETSANKFHR